MALLPCHPSLSVEDPLSVCEEDMDSAKVPKWKLVSTLLSHSSPPWASVGVLEDVISTLQPGLSEFAMLRAALSAGGKTEEEFLCHTLPPMVTLALRMPQLFPTGEIPVLCPGVQGSVSLSREQLACLLVHMFFCSMQPPRWNRYWANFHIWYGSQSAPVLAYLKCLLAYFEQFDAFGQPPLHQQSVSFHRCVLTDHPSWADSKRRLTQVTPSYSLDPESNVEVDFANKDIGFGVSGSQEEAKLAQSPETCVVMLLVPTLQDNEALIIRGARRVARFEGVARDIQFTGVWPVHDHSWDSRIIIAMDASELDMGVGEPNECPILELQEAMLRRELGKAYCGFSAIGSVCANDSHPAMVSTGHWGCGAFGGHKEAKALIQVKGMRMHS